jgi:hypothetical protein
LHWQEVGEQAPIQQIDGQHATGNIDTPPALVGSGYRRATKIISIMSGIRDDLRDHCSIAETKIEALGTDRWDHVRGFPNEGEPVRGAAAGGLDAERKCPATWFNHERPEDEMSAACQIFGEHGIIQLDEAIRRSRPNHTDQTRTPVRQRN